MSTRLEKFTVCKVCLSIDVSDADCICVYSSNYPTIELEFEVCACCGRPTSPGSPADSEFNNKQLE